jgi:hypothetical protein
MCYFSVRVGFVSFETKLIIGQFVFRVPAGWCSDAVLQYRAGAIPRTRAPRALLLQIIEFHRWTCGQILPTAVQVPMSAPSPPTELPQVARPSIAHFRCCSVNWLNWKESFHICLFA